MTRGQRDLCIACLGYTRANVLRHDFEQLLGDERGAAARAERLATIDGTIDALRALRCDEPAGALL